MKKYEKTSRCGMLANLALLMHAALCCVSLPHAAAQEIQFTAPLPHRWEVEPELGGTWLPRSLPPKLNVSPELLQAADRRTRLNAAQRALEAMPLDDRALATETVENALARLEQGEENRSVRLAMVSLVIASSNPEYAARLWKAVEPYPDAVPAVLQALVDWQSPVALEYCRQRLQRIEPPWNEVQLAIDLIAVAAEAADRQLIEGILRDDAATTPVRLAAARALGQVATQGLEPLARELLASSLPIRELLAAELLSQHNSALANEVLNEIVDQGPAEAVRVAFATLVRTDPRAAQTKIRKLSSHRDSGLRLLAFEVVSGFQNEAALNLFVGGLTDTSPSIRSLAKRSLLAMAADRRWRPLIEESTQQLLRSDSAAGIEQAILLGVELDQVEHCEQLIALLEHPAPNVSVTAAWALQELDVPPQLLGRLLVYATAWAERLHGRQTDRKVETVDFVRLAYVFERFGRSRYVTAQPVLNQFVPKGSPQMEPSVRASAIWALGKIEAGKDNLELAERLLERVLDNEIGNTENELVKFASALALGEFAPPEMRDTLVGAPENRDRKVWRACLWAAEEITRRQASSTAAPTP